MNVSKPAFIASVFALFLGFCIPAYAQATFKSSEFMEWPEANRSLYIRTSVGMAGSISGYNDEAHAQCLENWYFSDEKHSDETIYEVMQRYPEYHPRGIILAVLKEKCGTFEYSQRQD